MRQNKPLPEMVLPEFPYGSGWLVGAGDSEPCHVSSLALHALGAADAVSYFTQIGRTLD